MNDLFGSRIRPECRYCEHAYPTGSDEMCMCSKKGVSRPDSSCRHFRYDPIMRMPRRPLDFEEFDSADFALQSALNDGSLHNRSDEVEET